jgi:hypothetical protein
VGHFRPVRRVVDPQGQEWELYVTRFELPRWRTAEADEDDDAGWVWLGWLLVPVRFAEFLLLEVLVPLGRALGGSAEAWARARKDSKRVVEAICFAPVRETYAWETTAEHVDRVLAQVVEALERGELAQPLGAAPS